MIVRSATPSDTADVARLCWAYRGVLVDRMASIPGILDQYYAEPDYAALIDKLPQIHARPRGDILLAVTDHPVGCAMYYPISDHETEIKRIYVDPKARGLGAGRALISAAMDRAAADGYTRMVLDTVDTLTEAMTLYSAMGFAPCAPFYTPAPEFAPRLRFYDIPISPPSSA